MTHENTYKCTMTVLEMIKQRNQSRQLLFYISNIHLYTLVCRYSWNIVESGVKVKRHQTSKHIFGNKTKGMGSVKMSCRFLILLLCIIPLKGTDCRMNKMMSCPKEWHKWVPQIRRMLHSLHIKRQQLFFFVLGNRNIYPKTYTVLPFRENNLLFVNYYW